MKEDVEERPDTEERRIAGILENVSEAVVVFDPRWRCVYVNAAAERLIGRRREELLGRDARMLFPEAKDAFFHRLERAMVEQAPVSFEEYYGPLSMWVEVRAFPSPVGLSVFFHDIIDRKRAEEELRENETSFRVLFEQAAVGVARIETATGRFVRINQRYCDIVGYSLEEMLALDFQTITHPDDLQPDLDNMKLLIAGQIREFTMEKRYIHKDGRVVWVSLTVSPMWAPGAQPDCHIAVVQDITDRKRAEEEIRGLNEELEERVRERTAQLREANEALREKKERLRVHIENSPMAVVEWDSNFVVRRWAGEAENIFGWSAAETVGKPIMDLHMIYDEDIPIVQRTMERLTDGVSRYVVSSNRNYTRDGRVIHCTWYNSIVLDKEGRMSSVLSFVLDNTARIEAEEQRVKMERRMLQSQRLESLGVLAGGVAHDFNNLLTVILGNADLALDELPPMAPAGENIRRIVTASHRAAELCRQMLAYAGKGQLVRETIDLHALVEEMVSLLKASISKKALLTLNLEEDLPPMTGDPTQVRQILMNLVINASEAIGEGGVIKVAAGVMEYAGESPTGPNFETNGGEDLPPGRYLCLEVSDTGRGMDRATMERLFEPFFTTKFTGRGLGLSAVLGIVRAHKGAVKVCSEPGRGTTVKVLFPLLESEGAGEGKVQASGALDAWRGSGTVLLVDDEEAVRGVGGQMLQRLGFDVLIAADGREALDLYRQRHAEICLVMLDLNMPHMDGEEAYRELRRIDPEAQVVLASGYSEIDVASRFAGMGLAGVMQKPYTLANLRRLLSGLLSPTGATG